MKNNLNFAIIGAGIAGLSCARALTDAGFRVSVIDKSRGPSGRMSTRRGEDWACDHGAQYFTARAPSFQTELARWQAAGVAAVWQPRMTVFEADGRREGGGAEARYVGTPRMTAPAHHLAQGLHLRLQHTVTALTHDHDGWSLITAEHGRLEDRFDGVLLAVPSPQAVPLLQSLQSTRLPPDFCFGFANVARAATMQCCWTLMLRYDTPLPLDFDAAFVNHGPLRWVARNSSKPGRSGLETWAVHASAAWSEAHIEDDAETVATELIGAFMALGGLPPQAWSAHRWRYAITESATEGGCLWHADTGLGLCGDWLNGGRVEGAWLSGDALAQRVLATFA